MVLLTLFIASCIKHSLKSRVYCVNIFIVSAYDYGYKHPINIKPEFFSYCLYKIVEKSQLFFNIIKKVLEILIYFHFYFFTDTLKKEKEHNIIIKNIDDNNVHITVDISKIVKFSREISDALKNCTYKQKINTAHKKQRIPLVLLNLANV